MPPRLDHTDHWRTGLAAVVDPLLGTAVIVAVWWAATIAFDLPPYAAPAPPAVATALAENTGYLLANAWVTLGEASAGFTLAIATAVILGTVLAASRRLERALHPTLLLLSSIPKPAFAPLLVTLGGFGQGPKIVLVWLMCFFPVAEATIKGLTATPADLVELARAHAASRWATFVKIRLPAALPAIFQGLRTAVPLAVIGAAVAELFGSIAGLGFIIQTAGTDAALALAAGTLLGLMSITLYHLLGAAEQRIAPWIHHTHA